MQYIAERFDEVSQWFFVKIYRTFLSFTTPVVRYLAIEYEATADVSFSVIYANPCVNSGVEVAEQTIKYGNSGYYPRVQQSRDLREICRVLIIVALSLLTVFLVFYAMQLSEYVRVYFIMSEGLLDATSILPCELEAPPE
jgi:hypothetical protein